MSERIFTCIVCPNGCEISAEYEGTHVSKLTGASCPKGEDYVRQELTDPRRTISTSVPVEGGELPLVSVRLDRPIPKGQIFAAMAEINRLRVKAPVKAGDILLKHVCGSESNVLFTKNVACQAES